MRLALTLMDGQHLSFQVNKDVAILGRSPSCDIVIPHEGMSRQHCRIEVEGADVVITDLGSTNGVTIDGNLIPPQTPTKYNLWLPLAFGAVLSATIELEEESVPEYSLPIELEIPKTRDVKKARQYQEKVKATVIPKKAQKTNLQYFMSNVLAVLVLLGAFLYYYLMRNSQRDMTPKANAQEEDRPAKLPGKRPAEDFY